MKIEELKCVPIDKAVFEKELNNSINKYLYHFILCELKDNTFVKVDNYNNLNSLKDDKIKYKYYIEKIHYFKNKDNPHSEYGDTFHIYGIGYFYIGGIVNNEIISKEQISQIINKYKKDYDNLIKSDDTEFLDRNI